MMQCVQCVSVHANTCPHQKNKNVSLHRSPPHPSSHHSYHTHIRGAFTKTNILLKLQSEHDELSQISVFADKDERNPTARAYQMFVLATSPPDGFGTVRDKLLIRDAPTSPRRGSVHPASVVSVGSKLPRPMCTDSCAQYWTPRHFPKGTKYLQA